MGRRRRLMGLFGCLRQKSVMKDITRQVDPIRGWGCPMWKTSQKVDPESAEAKQTQMKFLEPISCSMARPMKWIPTKLMIKLSGPSCKNIKVRGVQINRSRRACEEYPKKLGNRPLCNSWREPIETTNCMTKQTRSEMSNLSIGEWFLPLKGFFM